MQDSVGTIVDIDFAEKLPPLLPKEFLLKKQPKAIYVKLDNLKHEFLMPQPCPAHLLFNTTCDECRCYPGVVQVTPQTQTWTYHLDDEQVTLNVKRTSFPLYPLKACSLYTLQGTTAEPGLVAHFDLPKRASSDIKFLSIYVMLSRPRSLKNLYSLGLDDSVRAIIEAGPPGELLETFSALFGEKAAATKRAARTAADTLGWCCS